MCNQMIGVDAEKRAVILWAYLTMTPMAEKLLIAGCVVFPETKTRGAMNIFSNVHLVGATEQPRLDHI